MRMKRSAAAILAAPLIAAAFMSAPMAHAWSAGGSSLLYEWTDGRWKTIVPGSTQAIGGRDSISASAGDSCPDFEFHYKRYNTLAPSTTLISLGYTGSSSFCGTRSTGATLASQGSATVFGNFRAIRASYPVAAWIYG